MNNCSIIREQEYKCLSSLTLDGKILDVGGSRISGYHELIKGDHEYVVININEDYRPDHLVNIEGRFPFENGSFDHAVCLNVLEHVYEFENVISETVRTIREDGTIIVAVPMMHHIHGSPDDYFRYTQSALRHLLEKYDCEVTEIHTLGSGFFSLGFQSIGYALPTALLRFIFKKIATTTDAALSKVSKKYQTLASWLPLGYMVIAKKNRSRIM